MAGNSNLKDSFKNRQDEFYTHLTLIENELKHYRDFFKGKVVLCNCDDPYESNFFKYFAMNFNALGLKKLITTCYASSPIVYTQHHCLIMVKLWQLMRGKRSLIKLKLRK